MSTLLIHSMTEFTPLIGPALDRTKARRVVEIGSEFGGMSRFLADHCTSLDGTLFCIDPTPKRGFAEWADAHAHIDYISKPSLEAVDGLEQIDAWVIDGDHNYYTVLNELKAADRIAQRDHLPLLAFLHDVSWPTARRDMYYAPDRIPSEHRHQYSFDHGVVLDHPDPMLNRGMRGQGQYAIAMKFGGPKNGVLTAVEDFITESNEAGRNLVYAHIPAVFGLGVIMDGDAEWAEDIAGILLPFHENPLISSLETSRLRNYLAVIDWQDRHQPD